MIQAIYRVISVTGVIKAIDPIRKGLLSGMDAASLYLRSYLVSNHLMGGTTDTRLRVRSGRLRSSVHIIKSRIENGHVKGGVLSDAKYSSVHIGPEGQLTVITPRRVKWLAIPLPPALTPAGNPKQSGPRGWPGLFFLKSHKPDTAVLARRTKAGIEPIYALKKRVVIKSRVHPEQIESATSAHIARLVKGAARKISASA